MTHAELIATVRQALEAATPGRWYVPEVEPTKVMTWVDYHLVAQVPMGPVGAKDADVIAHAPEWLATLCDALAQAEGAVERVAADCEEPLGTLRGLAEELTDLGQRLHSRLSADDIPWSAGTDMQGEFGDEHDRISRQLIAAEQQLASAIRARGGQ